MSEYSAPVSFCLPSSCLCCRCLVVEKDDIEDRECAPSLPLQNLAHPVECNNDNNNNKKGMQKRCGVCMMVFFVPQSQPALHVAHFTAHRTCLWFARYLTTQFFTSTLWYTTKTQALFLSLLEPNFVSVLLKD